MRRLVYEAKPEEKTDRNKIDELKKQFEQDEKKCEKCGKEVSKQQDCKPCK